MAEEYQAYFESKVNEQLMRALIQRKEGCKKLYRKEEWDKFRLPHGVPPMGEESSFLQLRKYFQKKNPVPELEDFEGVRENKLNEMRERYQALDSILEKFKGKLIVAGGCFTEQWTCRDLDFYFINCDPDERKVIIDECAAMICDTHYREDLPGMRVEEKENTTDIFVVRTTSILREAMRLMKITYQFINKSYPSIGDVLLDFDMYGAMIAYDGQAVLATDIGAWAYVNSCNVIDISWISPYFGLRFEKYTKHKNFRMIIPGIKPVPHLQPYFLPHNSYTGRKGLIRFLCTNTALARDPIMKNGVERFCVTTVFPKGGEVLAKREQIGQFEDARDYPKSNHRLEPSDFYVDYSTYKTCFFSHEVDTLLLLARRFDKRSLIGKLPKEILFMILHWSIFSPLTYSMRSETK